MQKSPSIGSGSQFPAIDGSILAMGLSVNQNGQSAGMGRTKMKSIEATVSKGHQTGLRFSIAVYNAMVRALVGEKQKHADLDDGWAVLQRQELVAENAAQARSLAARIFPANEGFVITEVKLLGDAA